MKIIEGVLIIIVAVLICNEVGTFLTSSNQKAEEEKAFRIECLLHEMRGEMDSTKRDSLTFQLRQLGYKTDVYVEGDKE